MKALKLKTLLVVGLLSAGLVAGCGISDRRAEIKKAERAETEYLNKKETCVESGMASFWTGPRAVYLSIFKCEDGSIYIFNVKASN